MGTTINSYSVGFGMDASGYIDGARISRTETRQLIKAIEDARTPSERFYLEYEKLEKAFQSGAISLGVYERLLGKQRDALNAATKAANDRAEAERKLTPEYQKQQSDLKKGQDLMQQMQTPQEKMALRTKEIKDLHKSGAIDAETYRRAMANIAPNLATSALDKYAKAIAGISIAASAAVAGRALINHVRETQNAIDDTIDAAGKLGVSYNDLKSLRFAAQEGGGVDAATTDAAIKKMLISTQKAIDGDDATRAAFERLGLDAGELMKQGPVKSVLAIAEGMKNVTSQGEKLALTMDIFGKSGTELVSTLESGADAIAESVAFHEQSNALTEAQLIGVSEFNDSWDRIGVVIDGVASKIAADLAPGMSLVADYLLGSSSAASSLSGFIEDTVWHATATVGLFRDAYELITQFDTNLDKAVGGIRALEDKKKDLENKAKQAEEEREKKKQQMLAEEIEMKESAAEKADRQREERERAAEQRREDADRKREQREKAREMEAEQKRIRKEKEDIIKNAEEAVKKRMEGVAKGPGAGMELGSAEAAKFFADQRNNAIANGMNKGEQTVLAEAVKQTQILQDQKAKTDKQIKLLEGVLEEQKKNGFKRLR